MLKFRSETSMRFTGAFVTCLSALLIATSAVAATVPQPGVHYLLQNAFLKDSKALGVRDGEVVMADHDPADRDDRNLWKFVPIPNQSGYFRLVNVALGDSKSLDSTPDLPNIRPTGNYSGQLWRLIPATGDYVRLSNMYQPRKALDNFGGPPRQPRLAGQANYSGQFWKLTPVARDSVKVEGGVQSPNIYKPEAEEDTSVAMGNEVVVNTESTPIMAKEVPSTTSSSVGITDPNATDKSFNGNLTISSDSGSIITPAGELIVKQPSESSGEFDVIKVTGSGAIPRFYEPGLGGLLSTGALPLVAEIYQDPELIVKHLKPIVEHLNETASAANDISKVLIASSVALPKPTSIGEEYRKMVLDPVDNPSMKGLMFMKLLDALHKPAGQLTAPERALVNTFSHYMQRRKLFIAEGVKKLYDDWEYQEMTKRRKTRLEVLSGYKTLPSYIKDEAANATQMSIKSGIVVASALAAGSAIATVTSGVAGVSTFAFIAPFAADAAVTSAFAVGTGAYTNFGAIAGAAAGPGAIIISGIAVAAIMISDQVELGEFIRKMNESLENAKKPLDLRATLSAIEALDVNSQSSQIVKKTKQKFYDELAYFWAMATGESGPVSYKGISILNPNRSTQNPEGKFDLNRPPSNVLLQVSYSNTARSALGYSGIVPTEKGGGPIDLAKAAWKSYAIAYNNGFDAKKINAYKIDVSRYDASNPWQTKLGPSTVYTAAKKAVCKAVLPSGVSVGRYENGGCIVAEYGKPVRATSNVSVLTSGLGSHKWHLVIPPNPIMPTVEKKPPTSGLVKAGITANGVDVYVCAAMSGIPGKFMKGKCYVLHEGKQEMMSQYLLLTIE